MVSGHITIEKKKINLDVTGLATPWIDSNDLTKDECRLKKHNLGEDGKDCYYILDICFFKGGALDYIVTWLIYQDKSLRTHIINAGDKYPDWYKPDKPHDNLTNRQVKEAINGECPKCYYKVNLVIKPHQGNNPSDYHWYRKDDDGTWSHKPGCTPVIPRIISPYFDSKLRGYTKDCGIFCIPQGGMNVD